MARDFIKKLGDPYASILSESKYSNITDWISTGSYSFNRVLSGSYKKGIANNRVVVFAGPSGVGKSVVCARLCRNAQKKGYTIAYFDSENAIDDDFMRNFGVDTDALISIPVSTISEFRNKAIKLMKEWRKENGEAPLMIFCDSLGNLAGSKEMNDVEEGKHASDMGQRAKELRSTARMLTIEAAQNFVPVICTNHSYEQSAANPQAAPITKMSGGEGFMYAASVVVYLKKKEIKEVQENSVGDNVKVKTGNIMTAKSQKNRLVPEGMSGEMYVDFTQGIQPYYGLLEDACEFGFIEPKGPRYYVKHLDKTVFEKQLYTKEVFSSILDELNAKVEEKNKFKPCIEGEENITVEAIEDVPEEVKEEVKGEVKE